MNALKKHYVTVCGISLYLVSDEEEDYIREVGRAIDGIIASFNRTRPTQEIANETRLLYAAFQLADDLFKERVEASALSNALREARASFQTQVEELQKERDETVALAKAACQVQVARAQKERDDAVRELKDFIAAFDQKK